MKAFISYSHVDEQYTDRLHVHLSQLKREGLLEAWHDRKLLAGDHVDSSISNELATSNIFIAMVSPDFIASEYCYSKEMETALKYQNQEKLRIVSIILEPCEWQKTPLSEFVVLPRDGKEVSNFTNQNTAFFQVAQALRSILEADKNRRGTLDGSRSSEYDSPSDSIALRYRSKRKFDDLDRANYRDDAFGVVSNYFASALSEVEQLDGISTRFDPFEASSFTASISNKNIGKVEHITVHSGSKDHMGDIYYANGERVSRTTSNGGFVIENDQFEQYFVHGPMGMFFGKNQKLKPLDVAEALWNTFIEDAGFGHG